MSDEKANSTIESVINFVVHSATSCIICTVEYYILMYSYHDKIIHRFVEYDMRAENLACKIRKGYSLEYLRTYILYTIL